MKAESTIRPADYKIDIVGDTAELSFYENISTVETDDGIKYVYDEYRMNVPNRETLADSISNNVTSWLNKAKNNASEELGAEVRKQRDALLASCDWTQAADSPLGAEAKSAWATYRQALRDIPGQSGFPFEVVFPDAPQ